MSVPKRRTSPRVTTLDLFSGIGGITLALSGLAHPVAYCDVDLASRAVLTRRMETGDLPRAPICTNVETLNTAWLRGAGVSNVGPDIIMGGFPCVGFSQLGLRKAFSDKGSGLFSHIVRLADELRTAALFLENVPGVLKMGMHDVVHELSVLRGYDPTWCVLAASDVGAPHVRKRWFCLATLPSRSGPLMRKLTAAMAQTSVKSMYKSYARRWASRGEGVTRMVVLDVDNPGCTTKKRAHSPGSLKQVSAITRQLELVGNSVVPNAVRAAFTYLLRDVSTRATVATVTAYARQHREKTQPLQRGEGNNSNWPTHGHFIASTRQLFSDDAGPDVRRRSPYLSLIIDPTKYSGHVSPTPFKSSPTVVGSRSVNIWPTPRWSNPRPSCRVTERTMRDLPTLIRFERDTPNDVRKGHFAPDFLEWMMGYPIGWTGLA